jgi:hypothetical protein
MWTIEQHVGRLIEVRLGSPVLFAELASFGEKMAGLLAGLQRRGQRAVGCVDLQGANLLPPDVSEWFIKLLQRDNSMLDRSAFLISQSAMLALQIERMIKQANNPTRRAFRDRDPMLAWLDETLSPPESARVRRFLDDGPVR